MANSTRPSSRPSATRATSTLTGLRRRTRVGVAVLAALIAAGLVLLVGWPNSTSSAVPAALPVPNAYGATVRPPWPAPTNIGPGMAAAALPISNMSAMAQHFHAHLDVIVDGQPVPVPANLGVDSSTGEMSALHTHDPTGLLHVESSDPAGRYILGQLFNEWNVGLDATRLGALSTTAGASLRTFVDGVEVPDNPAGIELRDHQQIALVYGPAGSPVTPPATYDFSDA